jgi:hypothetical protein
VWVVLCGIEDADGEIELAYVDRIYEERPLAEKYVSVVAKIDPAGWGVEGTAWWIEPHSVRAELFDPEDDADLQEFAEDGA